MTILLLYILNYWDNRISEEAYNRGIALLKNAVSRYGQHVHTSRHLTEDDTGTFMYLYVNPSGLANSITYRMEPIRLKCLLDYIDPQNPFHLISPNEFLTNKNLYSDASGFEIWTDYITPEPAKVSPLMDETQNKYYIHPDEQRMLTVQDVNGIRRESAWVMIYRNRPRSTELFRTDREVHDYNSRIKSDPMDMLHGGGKIVTYALVFILILFVVVMFLRTFIFTDAVANLHKRYGSNDMKCKYK